LNIDPKTPIAGVRPAVLKRVFRRGEFHVETFAKEAGVPLSEAPAKLRALARLGWVERNPKSAQWWRITAMGARLAGSTLLPPISVVRGRDLTQQVIDAAEAVNQDPSFTHLVSRLVLFGSLLTAPVDGKIGDVDIAFELVRRELDDDRDDALRTAELSFAPPGFWPYYFWAEQRVVRKLRKRSVSLHTIDDFDAIKASGFTIYSWDRESGRSETTLPW